MITFRIHMDVKKPKIIFKRTHPPGRLGRGARERCIGLNGHRKEQLPRWYFMPVIGSTSGKRSQTVDFDAPIESFETWLRDYIDENAVDCIILYNQYRPYNQIGWDIAKELDIECIVLELGLCVQTIAASTRETSIILTILLRSGAL